MDGGLVVDGMGSLAERTGQELEGGEEEVARGGKRSDWEAECIGHPGWKNVSWCLGVMGEEGAHRRCGV